MEYSLGTTDGKLLFTFRVDSMDPLEVHDHYPIDMSTVIKWIIRSGECTHSKPHGHKFLMLPTYSKRD